MSHSNRRKFLRNTSLAALGLSVLPKLSEAKSTVDEDDDLFVGGDCYPTTLDLYGEGPFYTENPPEIENGQLADDTEAGVKLTISGRVFDLGCAEVLPNTVIDVWHANDAGDYDNEGYNLRGKLTANAEGFYIFETIKPGKYLNGAQFRPSHIHFKITPPNHPTLTTQLYFEGDEDIPTDAAASVNNGTYDATNRIIPLIENENGDLEGTWDIVLDGDGSNGVNDLYIDKGVIYKTHPNPFTDEITISYGVFKKSKASLVVFDIQGNEVAVLDEKLLEPEKYEAVWRPDTQLTDGHYFICLKINDLQVHYLKVQKISTY